MNAPRVELIHDADCPNTGRARAALRQAFAASGLVPAWTEWDRADPRCPVYARGYGSPTILVNGRDVVGDGPGEGAPSCRLYADHAGAPDVAQISAALLGKGTA